MQNHKERQPWKKEEKRLAISIFLRSPSTYRYFREIMILPSESTIRMWLSSKKCHSTGFNKNLFEKIKIKVDTMSDMEKACVLMFDDMSIKQCLEYSPVYDIIEGFQDLGRLGRSNKIAKQASVFMIRGLYYQWKLPIGYFVSEKGLNGSDSSSSIKCCISSLENIGLAVKAIVCDQSTTNTRALKELGVSKEAPYLLNGKGDKIFAIYDPPHLLKTLRNNLLSHDFIYEERRVSFDDIVKLFELERQSGTIRAAHQLSSAHISPNNFQKMSVSLAAQIFSHTTAAALKTAIATGQLTTSTALETANFLQKINSLFDAMNSRTLFSKNPDNCALSKQNPKLLHFSMKPWFYSQI
ncbi:uncharacterized protein LOC120353042 [Nilaparvata lugens]|uniref:uncharacterized protein LOC120353042 n=1 Tax=Nilaparvata lugens TaxID=108931 RepID=UPI00193EA88D|nr:uncharacterized protein LOC120353042 [Nilaparvata lugens]